MSRTARYVPNHKSFGALMVSPQILAVAMEAGAKVVSEAIAMSPTSGADKGASDGTRYVEHFKIVPGTVTLDGNARATVAVVNDADYAAQVEFGIGVIKREQGGSHGVPSRPLGRAGAVVGEFHGGKGAWTK